MSRHHKVIWLDATKGTVVSETGTSPRYTTDFFVGDVLDMEVRCVDSAGTPVDITGYSYLFGIDDDYAHSGADLVRLDMPADSDPSSSSASLDSNGIEESIVRFNLDLRIWNVGLKAFVGTAASRPAIACLWAYDAGDADSNFLLGQFPVVIRNVVGQIADIVGSSSSSSQSESSLSSWLGSNSSVSSPSSASSGSTPESQSSATSVSSASSPSTLTSGSSASSGSSLSSISSATSGTEGSTTTEGIGTMAIGSTFVVAP